MKNKNRTYDTETSIMVCVSNPITKERERIYG